jgi:hypothetical protein
MTNEGSGEVVALQAALDARRRHFLGWQCRLRQLSVREEGGRPNPGMRAQVTIGDEAAPSAEIIVLITQAEPADTTAEFRHLVRRTHDPRDRYNAALKLLSAHYYQDPDLFSDEITALFGLDSGLADRLADAGRGSLAFDHFSQRFLLPCSIRTLPEEAPAFQATYWHNALFNASLPGQVRVLAFQPDWAAAVADPAMH